MLKQLAEHICNGPYRHRHNWTHHCQQPVSSLLLTALQQSDLSHARHPQTDGQWLCQAASSTSTSCRPVIVLIWPASRLRLKIRKWCSILPADNHANAHVSCRFFISQHPEVERKIEAELDSAGFLVTSTRRNPKRLEYADLSRLPYLSGAIKANPLPNTKVQIFCQSEQGGREEAGTLSH